MLHSLSTVLGSFLAGIALGIDGMAVALVIWHVSGWSR
jgi:hypothetical protein